MERIRGALNWYYGPASLPQTPQQPEPEEVAPADAEKLLHNLEVLAAFPTPGSRVMGTGDSAARVAVVGVELTRLYGLKWALSTHEDLTAINNVIQKSFSYLDQDVFKKISEGRGSFAEIEKELAVYLAAVKGFQNLCDVYGARYIGQSDPSIKEDLVGIATNCAIVKKRCADLIEAMQEQQKLHPMEPRLVEGMLDRFKGWVTEEEIAASKANKVVVNGIPLSRETSQDLHRTQMRIGQTLIEVQETPEQALESIVKGLHQLFGKDLSDTRTGDIIHLLASQSFPVSMSAMIHQKFIESPQFDPDFRLNADQTTTKNRVIIEKDHAIFFKEINFNRINNDTNEIDKNFKITARLEISIPLDMILDPRPFEAFSKEELINRIQVRYSMSGSGIDNIEGYKEEGEKKT